MDIRESITYKRKLATVKVFFNFLEFEDVISISPFRKINIAIKVPKKVPVFHYHLNSSIIWKVNERDS